MADDQEKTEEATPERRKKAREEGQFPRGKDAGNTAGSVLVLLVLIGFSDRMRQTLVDFCWQCFHEPYFLLRGDVSMLVNMTSVVLVVLIVPFAVAAALGATAAGVAEAGFHPNIDLAAPKWNRLEPLGKLKQMFSPQAAAVNISIQLLRVAAVAFVSYKVVEGVLPMLLQTARTELDLGVEQTARALVDLALWASGALATLVLVDYLYNRYKHEKNIMMSMQEIKDEHKQQEGDPRVRARQRARAREMAKRSVLKAVAEADVVIANPTHVSVAIRYRAEEGAPTVSTKGYDELALHIRELAKKHNVPIVENIPLARALAKRVKVGRSIPIDLYTAVAEVLAFVYRLKNRKLSA
jgi:flagellar biosynthetic protein FlhB